MKPLVAVHDACHSDAYPLSAQKVCLALRTSEKLQATVRFHNKNKPDEPWTEQRMTCLGFDGTLFRYETEIRTLEKTRYLAYGFLLQTDAGMRWLGLHGLALQMEDDGFFEYLYTQESEIPLPPAWACNARVYQIYPDRFARDATLRAARSLREWNSTPETEGFFGGNLSGIRQKIRYLTELGMDAVYLNPVFLSSSNHRYDTTDYYQVDPLLGTEQDLIALAEELHQNGIRLILDAVLDHCGVNFPPFQDVLRKEEHSTYKDWFMIDRFPITYDPPSYEAIGYYRAMPKLRQSNPQVQDYFLGVLEYWTKKLSLDGWRFDVADEIDPVFLQRVYRRLKELSADMLLIGEAWQENVDLVSCRRMDCIINYPFQRAATGFFARDAMKPEDFIARMVRALVSYPVNARGFNVCMLDCHDTARFWELCGQDVERLRCALAWQLLYPGIKLVYYGDEAGLRGGPDPDCRRTMPWAAENDRIYRLYGDFFRCSGKLKPGESAIVTDFLPVVALRREEEARTLWALVNMGEETKVSLAGDWLEKLFGSEEIRVKTNGEQLDILLGKRQCLVLAVKSCATQRPE